MGRICVIGCCRRRDGVVKSRCGLASAPPTCRAQLGQSTPGAQCNHVPLRLGPLKAQVLAQVAKAPEQTLVQLCQWVQATHNVVLKPSTLHKSLVRFGLTFKKTIYASEQQRAGPIA